jgi:predicted PurR-regulated permease PerM
MSYSSYTKRVFIAVGAAVGLAAVIYFAWQLARVFMILFAGILLAVFLGGMGRILRRHTRLNRQAAVILSVVGVLAVGTGIVMLVGPRLSGEATELADRLPQARQRIHQALSDVPWAQRFMQNAPAPQQVLSGGSSSFASGVTGAASTAATVLTNLAIAVVLGLYLSLYPHQYIEGGALLVPERHRDHARIVLSAIGRALRWWFVGRGASMAVVGVLTAAGLFAVGVPLALTLGLVAAIFSFVPYIGPIAAAVPALLVGLTVSPTTALYVGGVFGVVQFCESYLITPLIQERAVSIPPALLISAQVIAGVLAGLLGVLLATPLAVALVVIVQKLYVEDVVGEDVEALGEEDGHEAERDVAQQKARREEAAA